MTTSKSPLQSIYSNIELLKSRGDVDFKEVLKDIDDWLTDIEPNERQELLLIVVGLIYSSITGLTPEACHLAGISQYCRTNGVLQYLLSLIISTRTTSAFDKRTYFPREKKHFCKDSSWTYANMVGYGNLLATSQRVFNKTGYSVLPSLITKDHLTKIESDLKPYRLMPGDGKYEGQSIFIETNNPICIRANYHPRDLLSSDIIINLPYIYGLDNIARRVLGSSAFLQSVDCWYNFPNRFGDFHPVKKDSAQSFHFDMPGVDWLHFFIYLTTVTPENGPHAFIPCTSSPLSKSETLLRRGYQRVMPKEAYKYEHTVERQLCGPEGLVIQARTASWHRGVAVIKGHRKILQYVFGIHPFQRNINTNPHY